ncbi:hypothetical protein [Priestia megaterium]|uniref:hypothetical protein n=1 Tax=Priestia megaterium TaxID=1404 RepID=UPI001596C6B8|nr:hypothetical protein [Priestia megaterium]
MKDLETLEKEHFRIEQLACEARDKFGINSPVFNMYYRMMVEKEIEMQEIGGK